VKLAKLGLDWKLSGLVPLGRAGLDMSGLERLESIFCSLVTS
jgi:hypothetical protein